MRRDCTCKCCGGKGTSTEEVKVVIPLAFTGRADDIKITSGNGLEKEEIRECAKSFNTWMRANVSFIFYDTLLKEMKNSKNSE